MSKVEVQPKHNLEVFLKDVVSVDTNTADAKVNKDNSLMMEIFQSIFTPGVSSKVQVVIHAVFALLLINLIVLFVLSSYSIHVLVLLIAATGLWASLTWFVNMVEIEYQKQKGSESLPESKKNV
ncbi:ER protein Pkr1-domain-containing protein [Globomyces pollinis-pini]|nr:ER protein Pkr1-domain-containing protein [Globomyces pollinis-pini]